MAIDCSPTSNVAHAVMMIRGSDGTTTEFHINASIEDGNCGVYRADWFFNPSVSYSWVSGLVSYDGQSAVKISGLPLCDPSCPHFLYAPNLSR